MHKAMGLPVPLTKDSNSNVKVQSKKGKQLGANDVFIIDEAPMMPKYVLDIFDRKMREITQVEEPFGGKIVILGGDFRQCLPIKRYANRSELVNLSIRESRLWNKNYFEVFKLRQNKRTLPEEQDFAEFLLKLGNGELETVEDPDYIKVPELCLETEDLINAVFGEAIEKNDYAELFKRVILTTTNERALEVNNEITAMLEGDTRIYKSIDKADDGEPKGYIEYPTEFLRTLNSSGLPPHELKLKENTPVMLLRNLRPSIGLCNGTRLIVKRLHDHLLECEILTGEKKGNRVFITRISCTTEEGRFPFILSRRQFPVKPCYAMTINKSQGQTLEYVGIDLMEEVFSHGQLYVAFSRTISWDCVKVFVNPEKENWTRNVVWKEALS
uniref:ATP-dependent DNA helicase n=1 Tax=Acrobeloides nanus TaxID=290746 RepID=A0A914DXX8_9BILA